MLSNMFLRHICTHLQDCTLSCPDDHNDSRFWKSRISFCICLSQVFVYTPPIYRTIKDRFKTRGISDLSNVELASYFSPWSAEHIGKIQATSGNATVEGWATEHLRINFYLFTYNSLLKLHENASLLRKLDSLLHNEALLQLNLRTLSPAFKDSVKREWFHEVIDNNLKLWEVNLWSRTLDLMPHDTTAWEVPELVTTYKGFECKASNSTVEIISLLCQLVCSSLF